MQLISEKFLAQQAVESACALAETQFQVLVQVLTQSVQAWVEASILDELVWDPRDTLARGNGVRGDAEEWLRQFKRSSDQYLKTLPKFVEKILADPCNPKIHRDTKIPNMSLKPVNDLDTVYACLHRPIICSLMDFMRSTGFRHNGVVGEFVYDKPFQPPPEAKEVLSKYVERVSDVIDARIKYDDLVKEELRQEIRTFWASLD